MGAMLIIGMGEKPKKGPKDMNPMEKFLGKGAEKEPLVEDEAASKAGGKIAFGMPAGFKVPDGVKDGDPFDAMATLKVQNGKLVLHELDGTPVDDENEPSEDEMPEDMDDESETPADGMAEGEEEPGDEEDGEDKGLGFLDAIEKKAGKNKM
jgi:hypothetical protein